ncbi:MAG: PAS domain S-box protein, partial [Dehalococcoidia bacterium]
AHSKLINGKPVSTQGIFRDVTSRKRAEGQIVHLNSVLQALRGVNQLITRESNRERLIQQSCDILVSARGYEKAWILLVDENKNPVSVAGADLGEEFQDFLDRLKSGQYPPYINELWTKERSVITYDQSGNPHKECAFAGEYSDQGIYRCRLEYNGRIFGALGLTLPPDTISNEGELGLFLELCGDISFALATIEKEEERRRVEKELRESRTRLAEAQHIAHIGSWELDIGSNTMAWSDEVYRIFNMRPRKLKITHEAFVSNIHRDDREMVRKSYDESVKTKTPYNIVYRLLLKGGSLKYVNEKCETYYNEKGKPVRSIGTVQDITERRQVEDARKASEEKLRQMFESITDGITVVGMDFKIIQLNQATVRMHGYASKKELMGRNAFELIAEKDHAQISGHMQRLLKDGFIKNVEYTFLTRDGKEFPAELSAALLKDSQGNNEGFITVAKDITERKTMEEQLLLADRLASVGELASGIAHELNNPLTGIIGLSQ